MNNRLAVSLLCLENINKLDLFLKILKKNNIKLIELPISKITKNYSFNENELRLFKKKIEKYSIKVSSIQSIFFKKDEYCYKGTFRESRMSQTIIGRRKTVGFF